MIVTTDFETGNGKHIKRVGDRRWSVTEVGDKQTYCYYFHVELKAETDAQAGEVTLEVLGDADLKDPNVPNVGTQGLMGHCPCTIWVARWDEYHPLPMSKVDFLADRIVMRLEVPAEGRLRVTNVIPAPYTETVEFLKACADRMPHHAEFIEIGRTAEGRSLPGIHVTRGLSHAGKPRVVVFSGQHPIEFPGVFGSRGIADWLTSSLADAADVRKRYDVVIFPLVNPDGTFHGRNAFNAKGQDVYTSCEGAADGRRPATPEAAALWDFLRKSVPDMLLNIHCYCSLHAFVEFPMNGMYVLEDEALRDDARRAQQLIINEYVRWGSSGLTGHVRPNRMGVAGINHQMALAHGTFSILFEINASTHGPTGSAREALRCFRAMLEGYEAATPSAAE